MANEAEILEELGGIKRLSKTEKAFMDLIWSHPEGLSSQEIYAAFPQKTGTKSTILHRISSKGYVDVIQNGLHHIYKAKFAKREYNQALFRSRLKKTFQTDSLPQLICLYFGITNPTSKQLRQIEGYLTQLGSDLFDPFN